MPRVTEPRTAVPFEPICAGFRRFLHEQKLKFTPERAMMLDAVLRRTGLFEAEQLAADLIELGRHVSRATVYRTLGHLQDAGIVRQVSFGGKHAFYEVVAGQEMQDYLVCVDTGKVIPFSNPAVRQLRDEICRSNGLDPVMHQFHVFGRTPGEAGLREQTNS
jgi:Fur family ferric uptake transcriptional regulator